MRVSTEGYAMLTERVRDLCEDTDCALSFVLEGGYGLDTLSEGVAIVHETFDGRLAMDPDEEPSEKNVGLVNEVQQIHGLGSK
jgi:acetoin utilization deacetylase AcuC-like enzyme